MSTNPTGTTGSGSAEAGSNGAGSNEHGSNEAGSNESGTAGTGESASDAALARCIGVDLATFAACYWDSAPLLTRAVEPAGPGTGDAVGDRAGGFADLLTSADVDGLIADRGLRQPFFRVVQAAQPVAGVTRTAVAGSRSISDLADPDAIAAAHAAGATIVVNSLHRIWPPLVAFCRQLAGELGHPVQCNAYLTPAGNAQGFAFHHDTHDVFVLQVEGSKHWRIHRPVIELPTKAQARAGADLVGEGQEPLLDVVLEPGDSLYLPRGYVHAASTTDQPSLHLTIGVHAITWLDVLRRTVDQLGRDELPLRHALPLRQALSLAAGSAADSAESDPADSTGVAAVSFLKRTAEWLATLPADRVAGVIDELLAGAQRAEPLRPTEQAAAARSLTADTRVSARTGIRYSLGGDSERVALTAAAKRVELPAIARPMLERLTALPFAAMSPTELVTGDPACDVDDALVVVRRLLRDGLVVVAR